MIVSHSRRFIFFHNPKCAGTSLRQALSLYHDDPFSFAGIFPAPALYNQLDHAHLRLWEIQALFPRIMTDAETYRSVVCVRNPYRRFISAIAEHFGSFQRSVPLEKMPPAAQTQTIELFIENLLNLERVTSDYRFIHFSPQLWFIRFGDRQIPGTVLPMDDRQAFVPRAFECLGLEPQEVASRNRSRLDLGHALNSPKIVAFVRDFYASDFDFFTADPMLAHLADPP